MVEDGVGDGGGSADDDDLGRGESYQLVRWVDSGDVVTSGGLSSGIAMALHVVARHAARDLAVATARQIEYDWGPEAGVISG